MVRINGMTIYTAIFAGEVYRYPNKESGVSGRVTVRA